jgi:DNA-binding NarL/FixJ family response regulator
MSHQQRILVADSSKYFAPSFWHMLIPEPEFQIVGLADSTSKTVRMAQTLSPDIILVDLSTSHIRGLQTVAAVRAVQPVTPIVTFMPIASQEYAQASLEAGANACVTKSEIANKLLHTLRGLVSVPTAVGAIKL